MTNMAGTPVYQSPEQLKGEMKCGPSLCDVYALSCVIVELFTEQPIWPPGLTTFQLIYKLTIENQLPSYSHVPPFMQACCQAAIRVEEKRENSFHADTGMACSS